MPIYLNVQEKVWSWIHTCFGNKVATHPVERRERFAEECLEALQATGMSKDSIIRLAEHVYSRPVGDLSQEIAGVAITLDGLATAHKINRNAVVHEELSRMWDSIAKIRVKQEHKPRVSQENDLYPDRKWVYLPTDQARWKVQGKEDPFADYLAKDRSWLCCGDQTDDELANSVYLDPQIGHLTGAKERIRWLSRRCAYYEEQLNNLKRLNGPSEEHYLDPNP